MKGVRSLSKKKESLMRLVHKEIVRIERKGLKSEEVLKYLGSSAYSKKNKLAKFYEIKRVVDMPTKNLSGLISQLKEF